LYEPERHVVLEAPPWNPDAAKSAIQEIVDDAAGRFDADQFWPSHPMEDDRTHCTPLYRGAAGVIWAIDYLRRQGAAKCDVEFVPVLPGLLAANQAEFATFGEFFSSEQASLLMGDVGVLLLTMRLAPNDEIADELHRRVTANLHLPVMELMWGTPGTMLAAIFMYEMTGQDCWRQIYQQQAERLLGDLEETELGPLWTQDLYGHISRYLGCPYRKSNPNVLVMQPTDMRLRNNPSDALNFARNRGVLVQRQMRTGLVVICHVRS